MHGWASAGALVTAGAGKTDSDQQKEARSVNRVGNGSLASEMVRWLGVRSVPGWLKSGVDQTGQEFLIGSQCSRASVLEDGSRQGIMCHHISGKEAESGH